MGFHQWNIWRQSNCDAACWIRGFSISMFSFDCAHSIKNRLRAPNCFQIGYKRHVYCVQHNKKLCTIYIKIKPLVMWIYRIRVSLNQLHVCVSLFQPYITQFISTVFVPKSIKLSLNSRSIDSGWKSSAKPAKPATTARRFYRTATEGRPRRKTVNLAGLTGLAAHLWYVLAASTQNWRRRKMNC